MRDWRRVESPNNMNKGMLFKFSFNPTRIIRCQSLFVFRLDEGEVAVVARVEHVYLIRIRVQEYVEAVI